MGGDAVMYQVTLWLSKINPSHVLVLKRAKTPQVVMENKGISSNFESKLMEKCLWLSVEVSVIDGSYKHSQPIHFFVYHSTYCMDHHEYCLISWYTIKSKMFSFSASYTLHIKYGTCSNKFLIHKHNHCVC